MTSLTLVHDFLSRADFLKMNQFAAFGKFKCVPLPSNNPLPLKHTLHIHTHTQASLAHMHKGQDTVAHRSLPLFYPGTANKTPRAQERDGGDVMHGYREGKESTMTDQRK